MSCHMMRWSRLAVLLCLAWVLAPSAQAQPILWGTAAANSSFPNGRLMRIDYASGAIQATFNGPTGATIGDGFTGIAVRPSNGQVFVTDGLGSNSVFRVDPSTGAVLGSFSSPTGLNSIDGLEFLNNELYAHVVSSSTIVRINPDTGALIGTLPSGLPTGGQGGLTIVDGALFSHGSTGATTIARRNLATGALISEFATPNNEAVLALASDGASLFAASSAGVIYRLNPTNGVVLDSRNIGINLDGLGALIPIPEPSAALPVFVSALAVSVRRWRTVRRST